MVCVNRTVDAECAVGLFYLQTDNFLIKYVHQNSNIVDFFIDKCKISQKILVEYWLGLRNLHLLAFSFGPT